MGRSVIVAIVCIILLHLHCGIAKREGVLLALLESLHQEMV